MVKKQKRPVSRYRNKKHTIQNPCSKCGLEVLLTEDRVLDPTGLFHWKCYRYKNLFYE